MVWSSALITVYAVHEIGCAFAWPAAPLRLGLATVIVVHLAAIWRGPAVRAVGVTDGGTLGFIVTLSLGATIAATAATVLVFGPTLLLTTCV